MQSVIPRLLVVLCTTVALGSCKGDRALSPDSQGVLFASTDARIAPSNLTAVAVSSTQINLQWTDNATSESGLEVHRSLTFTTGSPLLATTAPNAVSYNDLGLTAATRYCYEVRAFRKLGKNTVYSAFSNVACATTLPSAPSNVNATPVSSTAVDVTWTDISTNETGFRVEHAASSQGPWTLDTTTAANATSYRDESLTKEQLICYHVIAISAAGNSAPSNVDCTTPPAAPSNLTATSTSDRIIDLAWSDSSAVEDGYEVQRSNVSGFWTVIASLPANAVSYHDATVSDDIRYSYRVRAKKDGGFSDFSAVASAVSVTTPPVRPSNVTAIPAGSTVVEVSWTDNSANEEGFRVERSIDAQITWVTVGTSGPGDGVGTRIGMWDVDRVSEQPVCYRVFAYNVIGSSDASNIACTSPPAAPTDLVATTLPGLKIELQWVNHSTVANGYAVQRVYYSYYYYYSYVTIATLGPNATSYLDTGLNPGEYNTYRILALKDGGQSDPSNEASAWTEPQP